MLRKFADMHPNTFPVKTCKNLI